MHLLARKYLKQGTVKQYQRYKLKQPFLLLCYEVKTSETRRCLPLDATTIRFCNSETQISLR